MPSSDTQFQPGNPGGGRKKGSRNKLSEAFIRVLADDFEKGGIEVIERLRVAQPAQYANVIAKLMPKIMDVKHDVNDDVKRILNVYSGRGE